MNADGPRWSATARCPRGISGTLAVRAPHVNDRRVDAEGERQRFTSQILLSYMRRALKVIEVLPILYLRGLSTGDFRAALPVLLGEDAAGLSPTTFTRLTAGWEAYHTWRRRDLHEVDYVYVWVDGVHLRVRLKEDRLCTLVMIGVRADGTKELIASKTATARAPAAGRRCCVYRRTRIGQRVDGCHAAVVSANA